MTTSPSSSITKTAPRHDHATWTAKVDRANLLWPQNMRATTLRRNRRLRGLTLATLLSETSLAAWDTAPPAITAEFRSLLLNRAAPGPKDTPPPATCSAPSWPG